MSDKIKVFASPLPFSNKRASSLAPVGSSIEEIVLGVLPSRLIGSNIGAIAEVNGRAIPRAEWASFRPEPGEIVSVNVIPMGGGDKGPLGTILSIAVMVAAPYVGAALGTNIGLGILGNGVLTAGQTAFFNGLVQGAFGIVGNLLVSAIAPPPKPSNLGNANNAKESPTQFIEGAQNAILRWGRVPIVLGTRRFFPPQAALPFTETKGNDQFVRQLFTWGYGDKIIIQNQKIGETDISQFSEVTLKHRLEGDLHLGTSIYTNDVFQEDYSVLLSAEAGYITRTTQPDIDEAIVDITFPQGLFRLSSSGKKKSTSVQIEIQYRLSGSSDPWSAGVSDYLSFPLRTLEIENINALSAPDYTYRKDIAVLNKVTGEIEILVGGTSDSASGTFSLPAIAPDQIRLATILISRAKGNGAQAVVSITDDRASSLFTSGIFETAGDFLVSNTGTTINFAAGSLKYDPLNLTASQSEALRKFVQITFPERGTYDIRLKRITADTNDDKIFDEVYLTAIKSVTYRQPVNLQGINGTGLLIRGSDQLNGTVDQYNAEAGNAILDYDADSGTWIEGIVSENPASLYIYVMQSAANSDPIPDDEIAWEDFEFWHQHCVDQGYSYNRVIDYDASVDDILRDIASAGAASPAIVDGKRTIVIDRAGKDVVQIVTPRNSWGYSGEMTFPDLPHAFRVQFANKQKGYVQDERIVYDDGYNEDNATKFEVLELASCVYSDLAFKTARRHIAAARLRPETHSFYMDIENLVALRGDRIVLEHDVPIVGVGDGRVKEVLFDDSSPSLVSGIVIDDTVVIPSSGTYFVRVRLQDGSFLYKQISNEVGSHTTLNFSEPFERPVTSDSPPIELLNEGDLLMVVEAGGELDLIITRIEPLEDMSARITAINYAPEIFDAENASIPPFESNITTPIEFIRPLAPRLVESQSGVEAMLSNSDGTYITRAIFTLANDNQGDIIVEVKVRKTGDNVYTNANVLEASPTRVILTGLDDGDRYDVRIFYRRVGATMISPPLDINGYLFIGASERPQDVSGFRVNVVGDMLLFEWDKNPDIDISHYTMKYSGLYSGAAWNTAQLLKANIYETRFNAAFLGGTYLIKAVDFLGNESENATAIITYDPSGIKNVIQVYDENPDWLGAKDNTAKITNELIMTSPELGVGYYYFYETLDLGSVFQSSVKAAIVAYGSFVNDIFDMEDIFAVGDIFGAGDNNIFDMGDIFATDDIFGIGNDAWEVRVEYRTTEDDPNNSPDDATWSDWQVLEAGNLSFRAIQFRLALTSTMDNVSPRVVSAQVTVDMPDRIERGNDLPCDDTDGATVTYPAPFKSDPAVVITIQDGDANDQLEYISKTKAGFTFKIYNTTSAAYVSRTFDFVASGYGREF